MHQLWLASASPRRKELLSKAGFQFHIFPVNVSEKIEKNLTPDEQVLSIARRKASAAWMQMQTMNQDRSKVILAADTLVFLQGEGLGKPADDDEAFRTLRRLSGNWHEVKTAVVILGPAEQADFSLVETTKVLFRPLTDEEIKCYIRTREPLDKAGSYAIQGYGKSFVKEIQGDFDNVVGLPMHSVASALTLRLAGLPG